MHIFQNFRYDFYQTFYKFDPCFGFLGVKMGSMFTEFLFEIHAPAWAEHARISYICEVHPPWALVVGAGADPGYVKRGGGRDPKRGGGGWLL